MVVLRYPQGSSRWPAANDGVVTYPKLDPVACTKVVYEPGLVLDAGVS